MPRRAASIAAAAIVILLAGCGDLAAPDDPAAAPSPIISTPSPAVTEPPSPSPSPAASTAAETEEEAGKDGTATADRPAPAGDCDAYARSAGWCTEGIGDYDCEGGQGNGPNYAPRDVAVVEPGVDPFGLDRNNDGKGCEGRPQADPAPPPPRDDPGTDPRFDTCGEAIDNGYGPYHRGQDPEYDWYRDADGDGVVCE